MSALICPLCLTRWAPPLRTRAGVQCGDLSKRQTRRCVGRLMSWKDYQRAEWIRPREVAAQEDRRVIRPERHRESAP